jgi:hypothetical protein
VNVISGPIDIYQGLSGGACTKTKAVKICNMVDNMSLFLKIGKMEMLPPKLGHLLVADMRPDALKHM